MYVLEFIFILLRVITKKTPVGLFVGLCRISSTVSTILLYGLFHKKKMSLSEFPDACSFCVTSTEDMVSLLLVVVVAAIIP
jgi:hypothetical protein